jgi:hypothetical protein
MSIKNHRLIGRYRNPENNRPTRVFTGTDSKTRKTVRFILSPDGHKIINAQAFRHWKRFDFVKIDPKAAKVLTVQTFANLGPLHDESL